MRWLYPLLAAIGQKVSSMPSEAPSEAIREMARRIARQEPLTGVRTSESDSEWGVYLLFGDEHEESGVDAD